MATLWRSSWIHCCLPVPQRVPASLLAICSICISRLLSFLWLIFRERRWLKPLFFVHVSMYKFMNPYDPPGPTHQNHGFHEKLGNHQQQPILGAPPDPLNTSRCNILRMNLSTRSDFVGIGFSASVGISPKTPLKKSDRFIMVLYGDYPKLMP